MSVTQRSTARRWLSLVAATAGTVAAATGTLSSTAAASSGVKGNTVASCEEASTRVDNTGTGLSGGLPLVFAAGVVAWPACDTPAREGDVLPVSELKSAGLATSATTPKQPSLAAVPEPSGQPTTTYSVRFGDCLSDIATSHNIADWQQLYAMNRRGISNPDLIYPSQLLRLPATQAP